MKLRLLYIISFLNLLPLIAQAQGFDWQYSARFPTNSPVFFIGVTGEFNYQIHRSELDFLEDKITCVRFDNGTGYGYTGGLSFENWQNASWALFGSVNFSNIPATFSKQAEPLPIANGDFEITEYNFVSQYRFIILEAGEKMRLSTTHFFVGASLQIGVFISKSEESKEKIIAPENAPPFPTNPPSYERTILDGSISTMNKFSLTPRIRFGYDFNLGNSYYSSISIICGYSLFSVTKDADWRRSSVSAGLTIYRGLFF
ncbi:MAG: hypothetical protein WCT77_14500 [Bacteroidota bacterium]